MSDETTTAAPLEPPPLEPPPIPFGEPEEPGPDETEEDGGGASEEVEDENRPIEIAAGDTRVEFISHEQTSHHRIGGTSAVRSFSVGEIRVKRAGSMNDDVQAVSIHRDTLAEIHARLAQDPPDVAAALLLLPPVV